MKVCLGMPTLVELQTIEDTVALCEKLGLSFVELNMNIPGFCPKNLHPSVLRKITEKTGINFTLHFPEEIDLASFHEPLLNGNIGLCKDIIEWSAEAGVFLLNLHLNPGIYFTLPDRKVWIYQQYQEQFLDNLVSSFSIVLDLAKRHGVNVCIENAYNFHIPFITKALEKISFLDGFSLTWDTGHDAKTGFKEREIIMMYEKNIRHMHLHDFNGDNDHQILFTGNVNINGMLQFANERGIRVVIETKTVDALTKSVNCITERWL